MELKESLLAISEEIRKTAVELYKEGIEIASKRDYPNNPTFYVKEPIWVEFDFDLKASNEVKPLIVRTRLPIFISESKELKEEVKRVYSEDLTEWSK